MNVSAQEFGLEKISSMNFTELKCGRKGINFIQIEFDSKERKSGFIYIQHDIGKEIHKVHLKLKESQKKDEDFFSYETSSSKLNYYLSDVARDGLIPVIQEIDGKRDLFICTNGNIKEESIEKAMELSDMEKIMTNIAASLSKNIPQRVDKFTVLTSVFGLKDSLVVSYSLKGASEVTDNELKIQLSPKNKDSFFTGLALGALNRACSDNLTRKVINRGAKFRYIYRDAYERNLFSYTVTKEQCKMADEALKLEQ